MKFNKQFVNFWRNWTKNTKCWGILRKFSKMFKKFLQKFVKKLYFSIFFKRFNKPMRSFFAVWTKDTNCWEILRKIWKFLMKIQLKNWILLWFLENLLLKIEPSDITPFFSKDYFGFGGGEYSHPLPPLKPPVGHNMFWNITRYSWQYCTVGIFRRKIYLRRLAKRLWKIYERKYNRA